MRPASDTISPLFASLSTEWLERHLPMLAELAEMGMTLARRIMEQADTPAEDGTPADPGLAAHRLARVGRMVGQTVALGAKLTEARRVRDEQADAGRQEQAASVRAARTQRQKDRMADLLPKARARHYAEFSEETRCDLAWLSDLELRIDLDQYDPLAGGASVADTVERISRGLGVPFDPAVWQEPGPDTGAVDLHPAVATTIAHRLRTARRAAQDRHLALLDAAIENRAEGDHDEAERLLTEAEERRDSKDYDPLVGDNIIAETMEQVSRMLGVPFDASVWRNRFRRWRSAGRSGR
jgi:hypothetical protein